MLPGFWIILLSHNKFNIVFYVQISMLFWPRHEKTCLWGFAKYTGADQPAHLHSLISAFVICFFESTIFNLATFSS